MIKMTFKVGMVVEVQETVEVSPLNYIKEGTVALIVDETVPNYVRIKFGYKCEWIDCKYLKVIND
jgi:hypothetical protein